MTNLNRLKIELNNKEYFTDEVYLTILDEHGLDALEQYDADNDEIDLLETVYSILEMVSNDIDLFRKVQTEFVETSQAYSYLQQRLADIRNRIQTKKEKANTADSIVAHLFCN